MTKQSLISRYPSSRSQSPFYSGYQRQMHLLMWHYRERTDRWGAALATSSHYFLCITLHFMLQCTILCTTLLRFTLVICISSTLLCSRLISTTLLTLILVCFVLLCLLLLSLGLLFTTQTAVGAAWAITRAGYLKPGSSHSLYSTEKAVSLVSPEFSALASPPVKAASTDWLWLCNLSN